MTDAGSPTVRVHGKHDYGDTLEVQLPKAANRLWLTSESKAAPRWELRLRKEPVEPLLHTFQALRIAGRLEDAERELKSWLAKGTIPRGVGDGLLARLAIDRGDLTSAIPLLKKSFRASFESGRISDSARDAGALVFCLLASGQDLGAARSILDQADRVASGYPEGRDILGYNRGLVAARLGDFRSALTLFRSVADSSKRLGERRRWAAATQEIAKILASLGRLAEALALQQTLVRFPVRDAPDGRDLCSDANKWITLSWLAYLNERTSVQDRSTAPPSLDTFSILKRAREALMPCRQDFSLKHALLNEAMFSAETGDIRNASDRLEDFYAISGGQGGELKAWALDVAGQVALRSKLPRKALRLFLEQSALARRLSLRESLLRGQVGSARAALALRRRADATAYLIAAEKTLDEWLVDVPLGEGRLQFLGARDEGTRQLADTLVEIGAYSKAFRVVRLARVRALRQAGIQRRVQDLGSEDRLRLNQIVARFRQERARLEASIADAWTHSAAELTRLEAVRRDKQEALRAELDAFLSFPPSHEVAHSQPEPGELQILYFPAISDWLAFSVSSRGVTAERVEVDFSASREDLSRALLAPFAQEIGRASRVVVLGTGPIDEVDIHRLPWRGKRFDESVTVAYGLGLSRPGETLAVRRRALVVGNPTGDLPGAEDEARKVAALLQGFELVPLLGPAADRGSVLGHFAETSLFHFAGHGEFKGREGLDSSLILAGHEELTVADVLTSARVPAAVVLSACDLGKDSGQSYAEGYGIAQAFLSAGAALVIAPRRKIADGAAMRFFTEFYGEFSPRVELQTHPMPSEALIRAASIALREAERASTVPAHLSFRLMIP